jgi:maltooligosyltrehalose synthase
VVALARRLGDRRVLCIAPRLWLTLGRIANGTGTIRWRGAVRLPDSLRGRYQDQVTGRTCPVSGRLPLDELLADFPVALLRSI